MELIAGISPAAARNKALPPAEPDPVATALQKQIDERETDNKLDDEGSYLDGAA